CHWLLATDLGIVGFESFWFWFVRPLVETSKLPRCFSDVVRPEMGANSVHSLFTQRSAPTSLTSRRASACSHLLGENKCVRKPKLKKGKMPFAFNVRSRRTGIPFKSDSP